MTELQRRSTHRVPFTDDIRFLAPRGLVGKAVDIGAGGIGLVTPRLLSPGTQVEIEIFEGRATAFGTVRWCRQTEEGFRAGIQFREEDWAIMELIESLQDQEG